MGNAYRLIKARGLSKRQAILQAGGPNQEAAEGETPSCSSSDGAK